MSAHRCVECGHLVAGLVPASDPTVVCTECNTDDAYGVHVKPRLDTTERRWYPGVGERRRFGP